MSGLRGALAALVYPTGNACHLCRAALDARHPCLCARCEAALAACALPPPDRMSLHAPLAVCLSAFVHANAARSLCHRLKYGGDRLAALPLALGMLNAFAGAPIPADVAVPVPLSPSRLRERGYNQASLLAREVCAATGLALCEDALARRRQGRTQASLTREERLLALSGGMFQADGARVLGRRVLLVDDVLTTGATASVCAHALIAAGAESVSLLTACRA